MSAFSGTVVYILTWWIVFFCVLPFNIQSIIKPTDGTMPGAPVNPRLKMKILATTFIAGAVWLVIDMLISANLISFREMADRMAM